MQKVIDWTFLWETAARHGVSVLLYWHLKANCPDAIPEAWNARLGGALEKTARRNAYLTAQLLRILEQFNRDGILAIPYKGPALAVQAYGNLALRQFLDLDIAVRHGDVASASKLLEAAGFRAELDLAKTQKARGMGVPGQFFFELPDGSCIVELHTERTLRYFPVPLDLETLARRLISVRVGGRDIRTFSTEDLLTILSVHASKHLWERLMWLSDIAGLIVASPRLDWDAAEGRATQMQCERMFYTGLCLARGLLDAPVPEAILRRASRDRGVQFLVADAESRLLAEKPEHPGLPRRFLIRLQMRSGLWHGIQYAFRLGTSPTEEDWAAHRLPAPLAPFYRLLRPFRLLQTHGISGRRDSGRV